MHDFIPPDDRDTEAAARRRIARWGGVARRYDAYRPATPRAMVALLTQLAGASEPAHVVDLGAGSGLSTLAWTGRATRITGIEPNDDMRRQAETRLAGITTGGDIRFVAATADRTGLPDGCADIVTASQAFHWMEPESTLTEVARILRPGGVFAAYDYDWPPTITVETDLLFHAFMARAWAVAKARGVSAEAPGWQKSDHLERMRQSGHFRMTKEIALHSEETGDADRFIGLVFSNVVSLTLARDILAAKDLDVEGFERSVRHVFAERRAPGLLWRISYHARVGVT